MYENTPLPFDLPAVTKKVSAIFAIGFGSGPRLLAIDK
jgi:hypothetical protein